MKCPIIFHIDADAFFASIEQSYHPALQGKPVVVDWQGCRYKQVGVHNITVPAAPVFPAEQVTWFSPEPVKDLFRHTTLRSVAAGYAFKAGMYSLHDYVDECLALTLRAG